MSRTTSTGVTAIVLTLNEAAHLQGCLNSLRQLTDDVVVFDSGSIDATRDIATSGGARVESRAFDGYATQRNAALGLPNLAAWVLFLDADERLSLAGAAEMQQQVADAGDDVAAFAFPRRNVFFGRTLRGGGWSPDYQTRLLRIGRAIFDADFQVHERVALDGACRRLTTEVVHFNYASWHEFREKQREYSRQAARDLVRAGHTSRRRCYVGMPLREWKRRVVSLRGYRDGWLGLRLSFVMALEQARICWLVRHHHGAIR
jgi:glycosyltransferase involved in cell wall biosynthesis